MGSLFTRIWKPKAKRNIISKVFYDHETDRVYISTTYTDNDDELKNKMRYIGKAEEIQMDELFTSCIEELNEQDEDVLWYNNCFDSKQQYEQWLDNLPC